MEIQYLFSLMYTYEYLEYNVSGTGDQYSAVNIYVLNYVIKPIKYMRR
jgi:hypothetical protein